MTGGSWGSLWCDSFTRWKHALGAAATPCSPWLRITPVCSGDALAVLCYLVLHVPRVELSISGRDG